MSTGPATLPAFSDDTLRREVARDMEQRRYDRRALRQMFVFTLLLPLTFTALSLLVTAGSVEPVRQDTTRNQAFEIAKSVELFKLRTARFPAQLSELTQPPRGHAILEEVPRDEWGREFVYLLPGLRNPAKFDVVSYGEDGVPFTGDDRGNFVPAG